MQKCIFSLQRCKSLAPWSGRGCQVPASSAARPRRGAGELRRCGPASARQLPSRGLAGACVSSKAPFRMPHLDLDDERRGLLSPSAAAAPPGHCLLSQFAGLGDCGDEGRRALGSSLSTRADHPSSPLSFPAPSLLSSLFFIQKTVTTIVPKQAPLVYLEPNQHVGEHLHTSLFLLDLSIAPSRAPFGPAPHATTEPSWPPAAGHHQAFPGRTSPQNGTSTLQ